MRRQLFVILAMLAAVAASAADKLVLTMAWTAQAEFAGYYVALDKGFYKEAGVEVDIQYPTLTSSVATRMESGESHAAILSLMSAMKLVADGKPIVNVLQTSMNNSYMIVSRWGDNPLRMKGKRVAVYNSEPNYLGKIMDGKEHMDYEWIRFTSNINLFLSGAVDAMMIVSYAEYNQLMQAGFSLSEDQIYRFSDNGYNIQENGVYVNKDYLQSHRDQVESFVAASKRGWRWVADHPDEALEIVMHHVKKNKVQTNRVMQNLMLKEILRLQLDSDSGKQEFRLREDMVEKACQLMMEKKMLRRKVTYSELKAYD